MCAQQVGVSTNSYLSPFLFHFYDHKSALTKGEKHYYVEALQRVQEQLAQGRTLDEAAPELDSLNQMGQQLQPVERGYSLSTAGPMRVSPVGENSRQGESSRPGGFRSPSPERPSPRPPSSTKAFASRAEAIADTQYRVGARRGDDVSWYQEEAGATSGSGSSGEGTPSGDSASTTPALNPSTGQGEGSCRSTDSCYPGSNGQLTECHLDTREYIGTVANGVPTSDGGTIIWYRCTPHRLRAVYEERGPRRQLGPDVKGRPRDGGLG